MNLILARFVRFFWRIAIFLLVAVAVLVSLAKVTLPQLYQYRSELQSYLSSLLGTPVTLRKVDADWQNFQPMLALQQLTIGDTEVGVPLRISSLELKLDMLGSLVHAHPVFASLLLKKVELVLRQNQDGKWQFADRVSGARNKPIDLLELLLAQGRIGLQDIELTLIFNDGIAKQLAIPSLSFHCLADLCASEGRAEVSGERAGQLSFAMNLISRPGQPDFGMEAFARLQALPVGEWLERTAIKVPKVLDLRQLELGGEVWLSVGQGQLNSVQGRVTAPQLQLQTSAESRESLTELQTDFLWQRTTEPGASLWQLDLNGLSFNRRETVFSGINQRWTVSESQEGRLALGAINRVDLESFTNLVVDGQLLPEKARQIVATLQPEGALENLLIQLPLTDTESSDQPGVLVKANLANVGVSAWKHAPKGTGVNGYLEVTARNGLVQLQTNDFRLHFPKLYSDGWHYQQASGEVSWHVEGKSVWLKGRQLRLADGNSRIHGQFDLDATKNGAEPRLNLLIGMSGGELRDSLAYVPDRKLSSGLTQWLDKAIGPGEVDNASFTYSGSAVKGADTITRSLRLLVNAQAEQFQYLDNWPVLKQVEAKVELVDKRVAVSVDSAQFYESLVSGAEAEFVPDSEGGVVTVRAKLEGSAQDGLRVLQETPIRKALFDLVDDFQVSGDIKTELELSIPLKGQDSVASKVMLQTGNAQFVIPSLNLNFNRIEGDFSYGSRSGLNAQNVKAMLFDEPVSALIQTREPPEKRERKPGQQTRIQLQGAVTAKAFQQWLPLPALQRVEGKATYAAELRFGGGEAQQIRISSDLVGIEADLPEPLAKSAEQKRALDMLIRVGERQTHHLSYGELVNYALWFDQGAYRQGEIRVGGGSSEVGREQGVRIYGTLPELDFAQWQSLFELYEQGSKVSAKKDAVIQTHGGQQAAEGGFLDRLKQVELVVDRFVFADRVFESMSLGIGKNEDAWRVQLENTELKGVVLSYGDESKPLEIALEYLRLPAPEQGTADALQDVIPQQLPLLDFKTDRFALGTEEYGAWAFKVRPNDKGTRIENLNANVRGLELSGEIDWRYQSDRHLSEFSGMAVAKDTGDAVEAWGYSRSVEGSDGKFIGNLKWNGSPAMFSLMDSIGELTIRGDQGRFIEVESSANVLRLFGILNFTSLARRLRLDFSDLFKKGYSFDKVRGKFALNQGKIQIVDSLIIDGPSAKFKIDGRTDLHTEELDQEMIVVLPLTDNIPLAATIVGAPQVGIPIYLINKVFGNMFERFTSARYKVTGTWEDPKIELVKMFENRARQKPKEESEVSGETQDAPEVPKELAP